MTFLRLSLLLATVFSCVLGCSIAVRKARDFAVSKADELAGEAALKKLDEVNPQLAAAIRAHIEAVKAAPAAEGEEASGTPYLDAFRAHWGEGAATLLLLLLGKFWRTAAKRKELLGVLSKAVGSATANGGNVLDAIRHEVEAAGLSGSMRKNLEAAGVKIG